jgi:hypothetical protein
MSKMSRMRIQILYRSIENIRLDSVRSRFNDVSPVWQESSNLVYWKNFGRVFRGIPVLIWAVLSVTNPCMIAL